MAGGGPARAAQMSYPAGTMNGMIASRASGASLPPGMPGAPPGPAAGPPPSAMPSTMPSVTPLVTPSVMPPTAPAASPATPSAVGAAALSRYCMWERDLLRAGVTGGRPAGLRFGPPVLALAMLVAAGLVSVLGAGSGDGGPAGAGPLGLALLAAAGVGWVGWLALPEAHMTATFAAVTLVPPAALGVAESLAPSLALGSDLAYRLATFPVLLVILLYVAATTTRLAVGAAVAGYGAFGVPLLLGWARGEPAFTASDVVTWHVGFAFCLAAGYAVRLAYLANAAASEAREALARQAAAEQRRQAAQEVHDVVAHTLAVTMLHITAARMALRRSAPEDALEALEEAERHGRSSLTDIRRVIRLLRADDTAAGADRAGGNGGPGGNGWDSGAGWGGAPAATEAAQPGLADVAALVASYRSAGLEVQLALEVDEASLAVASAAPTPSAELAVYRVLQEALANATRHGDGPATVRLRLDGEVLTLDVENPIRPGAAGRLHRSAGDAPHGSGLIGMAERVSAAGGTVEAGAVGGRWAVRARIPLGAAA